MLNGESILAIGATVAALTQLIKWAFEYSGKPLTGFPAAGIVLVIAAVGVLLWTLSNVEVFERTLIWPFFTGWISIATTAAGIFGFTRVAADKVANVRS